MYEKNEIKTGKNGNKIGLTKLDAVRGAQAK